MVPRELELKILNRGLREWKKLRIKWREFWRFKVWNYLDRST